MKQMLAKYSSTILAGMSFLFVTTMCGSFFHMPEPPEELVDKNR